VNADLTNLISGLSDQELDTFIRDLRLRIAANKARIESSKSRRRRSLKIARGTVLTAGGFVGANFDWLAALLTVIGAWDWIDAFAEDARITNQQLELLRDLALFEDQFVAAAVEFQRRTSARQPDNPV
jgi:hypothetical protein